MSELKAVHAFDVYEAYTKTGDDDAAQVYLKSEADKVIAEKDKEIEVQKRLRNMALASVPNVLKVMKIIQHHKYKRCIDLWSRLEMNCNWYANRLHSAIELGLESDVKCWTRKLHHAKRWRKRWLELAEKFKKARR